MRKLWERIKAWIKKQPDDDPNFSGLVVVSTLWTKENSFCSQ